MKFPKNGMGRIRAIILLGLFGGVVVIAGLPLLWEIRKPSKIPIEQALWVADWEIERIYGPGTPEQQKVVEQLGEHLEFDEPVLYRVGGSSVSDPSEGFLLYGFDPKRPEMGKHLSTVQRTQGN